MNAAVKLDNATQLVRYGFTLLKGLDNHKKRKRVEDYGKKEYANAQGTQQEFAEICRTNPEKAKRIIMRKYRTAQRALIDFRALSQVYAKVMKNANLH